MLNHIDIQGRLTKDPELRATQTGKQVASFTVAVDRDFAQNGAERTTDFIQCVAWEKTGEFVQRYFTKGQMITVSGRLQSRKWKDKNGDDRISWEILVQNAYFCGKKESSAPVSEPTFTERDEEDDGELPFDCELHLSVKR